MIDAHSGRDQLLIDNLKEEYLLELEEMARWKSMGHALFAIRILARMARLSEEEIGQRAKAVRSHDDRSQWVDEL